MAKFHYYAVYRGHKTGVFTEWKDCKSSIDGFKGSRFKGFNSKEQAERFVVTGKKPENDAGAPTGSDEEEAPENGSSGVVISSDSDDSEGEGTGGKAPSALKSKAKSSRAAPYSKEDHKKKKEAGKDKSDAVEIYTDAACWNNGQNGAIAGVGVYWGPDDPRNVSEPLEGRQTNNRAEITAVCRALEVAKKEGIPKVKILTDSDFTIKGATEWMSGWKKRGWKLSAGGDVKNKEEFERLDQAMQGIEVEWEHVKGHSGVPGNEAADKLATEGAKKQLKK